jgi:hypothetical protein
VPATRDRIDGSVVLGNGGTPNGSGCTLATQCRACEHPVLLQETPELRVDGCNEYAHVESGLAAPIDEHVEGSSVPWAKELTTGEEARGDR